MEFPLFVPLPFPFQRLRGAEHCDSHPADKAHVRTHKAGYKPVPGCAGASPGSSREERRGAKRGFLPSEARLGQNLSLLQTPGASA